MLRFFLTQHELPVVQTPYATPLTIRSAGQFAAAVVPLSHIYLSTSHYLPSVVAALGTEHQDKLEELPAHQRQAITTHRRHPVDFRNQQFASVEQMQVCVRSVVGEADEVNFLVVNGIGNGLGDNFVGLGVLQRLTELLYPIKSVFHLMQELDVRIAPVYQHQENVRLCNAVMSVTDFFNHDFFIDLDTTPGLPQFDSVPAAVFMAQAFSINQLVCADKLQPKLVLNAKKMAAMQEKLATQTYKKVTVLLHPKASTAVRSMPSATTKALIAALTAQGYQVVSAMAYDQAVAEVLDLSAHSQSVDDLVHIIAAVDAVISVGTVVYHLAAALNKATLLLPTVRADVQSASLLPQVLTYLPEQSRELILSVHKSAAEQDLTVAARIWRNVDAGAVVHSLGQHIEQYIE